LPVIMVFKKIGGICLLCMEASLSVPMLWFLELIPWYVNEETRLVCTLDYERGKKKMGLFIEGICKDIVIEWN
jgi:hypothetical protein